MKVFKCSRQLEKSFSPRERIELNQMRNINLFPSRFKNRGGGVQTFPPFSPPSFCLSQYKSSPLISYHLFVFDAISPFQRLYVLRLIILVSFNKLCHVLDTCSLRTYSPRASIDRYKFSSSIFFFFENCFSIIYREL